MTPLVKPLPGEALLDRQARRAKVVAHEQVEMRAAKKRDKYRCRYPACEFKSLVVDACHMRGAMALGHRGMGGNPNGTRTDRRWLITLCRRHHMVYDRGHFNIDPMTVAGANGEVVFSQVTSHVRFDR